MWKGCKNLQEVEESCQHERMFTLTLTQTTWDNSSRSNNHLAKYFLLVLQSMPGDDLFLAYCRCNVRVGSSHTPHHMTDMKDFCRYPPTIPKVADSLEDPMYYQIVSRYISLGLSPPLLISFD